MRQFKEDSFEKMRWYIKYSLEKCNFAQKVARYVT